MIIEVRKNDNRIISYAEVGFIQASGNTYIVEVDVENVDSLLFSTYENGQIVFDQDVKDDTFNQWEIEKEKINQEQLLFRIQKKSFMNTLEDSQAYSVRLLFDEWKKGETYKCGKRFMYNGKFYKTLQDVPNAQAEYTPDIAVSLYVEIPDPSIEWPEWVMPTGAHNAYDKGTKVTHNGYHYISKINGNITEPGTDERYWEKVEGEK